MSVELIEKVITKVVRFAGTSCVSVRLELIRVSYTVSDSTFNEALEAMHCWFTKLIPRMMGLVHEDMLSRQENER